MILRDNSPKQEVQIVDLNMPFSSMVRFMVKWTIATVPAIVILVLLTVATWTFASGFFSSIARAFSHVGQPSGASMLSTTSAPLVRSDGHTQRNEEEINYRDKVLVKNVTVGQGYEGLGVFGEVKNNGTRALKEVEITIFCLDKGGKPVFEKSYHPVLDSSFDSDVSPALKAGYSRQFGVKLNDAPSDWSKKVDVKVTEVHFQ